MSDDGKPLQHAFNRKLLSWVRCAHCGLILLNNRATRRAMNAPCPR